MKFHDFIEHCLQLVIMVLGILGTCGGLYYSLYFPKSAFLGLFILVFIGGIIYFCNIYQKKSLKWSLLVIVCFFLVGLLLMNGTEFYRFFESFKTVVRDDYFLKFEAIIPLAQGSIDTLSVAIYVLICLPIVYVIVSLITHTTKNFIKLLGLLIVYIFPVLIRHSFHTVTSYCFIFFFLYQMIFSCILKYQKKQYYLKIIIITFLCVTMGLSSIFLESNPIFKESSTTVLMNMAHWIDRNQAGANITGASIYISGSLPTTDITVNQRTALTITSDHPFSSYLRGYSLANYSDNQWHEVTQDSNNIDSVNLYSNYLQEKYQSSSFQVKIESSTSYQFVPYYTLSSSQLYKDSYYRLHEENMTVLSHPMNTYDLNSDIEYDTPNISYEKYVNDQYLSVPDDLKNDLTSFMEDQFLKKYGYDMNYEKNFSINDWADFVKECIHSQTTYNLKTGSLPSDKDFVEYFLFENQKGSCSHYATTGALMLRVLGIPTRFVKGFVVDESDFIEGVAKISNSRSHAWIEIYRFGVGWIPYEMTPSGGNSISDLTQILDNPNQTITTPVNREPTQPAQTTPTNQPNQTTIKDSHWYDAIIKYKEMIMSIGFILFLLIVYRFISTHRLYVSIQKKTTQQQLFIYYKRLIHITRFGGQIDETIIQLANKARFSQHTITSEEVDIIKNYTKTFSQNVYQSLPGYQKLIYKYIFGYC